MWKKICILKLLKYIMSISASLWIVLVKSVSFLFFYFWEKCHFYIYVNFCFMYFEPILLVAYKFSLVSHVIIWTVYHLVTIFDFLCYCSRSNFSKSFSGEALYPLTFSHWVFFYFACASCGELWVGFFLSLCFQTWSFFPFMYIVNVSVIYYYVT